jgi:hypothetical protein
MNRDAVGAHVRWGSGGALGGFILSVGRRDSEGADTVDNKLGGVWEACAGS